MTFPQFKYLLYTNNDGLEFNKKYPLHPALCVTIDFAANFMEKFKILWLAFKKFIKAAIPLRKYLSVDDMVKNLVEQCGINKYKAQSACEIIMAAMSAYMRLRSKKMNPMFGTKTFGGGQVKYFFTVTVNSFFGRTEQLIRKIFEGTRENQFYLTDVNNSVAKEYSATLGILEAMGALSFNMTGGANSQIFIHIGQIGNLKKFLDKSIWYRNRILDAIAERHKISVKMFTYIYEGNFTSAEIWNLLEDYFIGKLPPNLSDDVI